MMIPRVTQDEFRALQARVGRGQGQASVATSAKVPASPYRSKLEASYADYLELQRVGGLIQWWAFEPIKIRLPAKRCWYTVDFLVQTDTRLEGHEVKGFMREDAALKLKLAARAVASWLPLILVKRSGRTWWEWMLVEA